MTEQLRSAPPFWIRKLIFFQPSLQAEEFVEGIAKDRLESVVSQAMGTCPDHTLALLVEGLEHYLTLRQRRDYQVALLPPSHIRSILPSVVARRLSSKRTRVQISPTCSICTLITCIRGLWMFSGYLYYTYIYIYIYINSTVQYSTVYYI
jgi:hypothetical protein